MEPCREADHLQKPTAQKERCNGRRRRRQPWHSKRFDNRMEVCHKLIYNCVRKRVSVGWHKYLHCSNYMLCTSSSERRRRRGGSGARRRRRRMNEFGCDDWRHTTCPQFRRRGSLLQGRGGVLEEEQDESETDLTNGHDESPSALMDLRTHSNL